MPIRLLKFNLDGTEIRLIERGELWRIISSAMELAFDEGSIQTDIQHLISNGFESPAATDLSISAFCADYQRYAILSHTWLQNTPGEVTYGNWMNQKINQGSAGYQKLANFCRVAATEYGLTVGWMDTICINKESSSELDESIRSMYSWYETSTVCITYLAGTTELGQMHKDPWFTRGWTLQEMVAPQNLSFYSVDWNLLVPGEGDDKAKPDIMHEIVEATTITEKELRMGGRHVPISRRMQWAAKRQVTREEDRSYSLMGMFDVSISTAYGEGAERAFVRLLKEILNTNTPDLLDIVNHGYVRDAKPSFSTTRTSSLIPPSPRDYLWRAESNKIWSNCRPKIPINLTPLGLQIPVLLIPGISCLDLPASHPPPFMPWNEAHRPAISADILQYDVQYRSQFKPEHDKHSIIFAILNHLERSTTVQINADLCFAVALFPTHFSKSHAKVPENGTTVSILETERPIILKFDRQTSDPLRMPFNKVDLEPHGMYLRTLYFS